MVVGILLVLQNGCPLVPDKALVTAIILVILGVENQVAPWGGRDQQLTRAMI